MATTNTAVRTRTARATGAGQRGQGQRGPGQRGQSGVRDAVRSPAATRRAGNVRGLKGFSRPQGTPAPQLGSGIELRTSVPTLAPSVHQLAGLATRPVVQRHPMSAAPAVLTDRGWLAILVGFGLLAALSVAVMVSSFLSISNLPLS